MTIYKGGYGGEGGAQQPLTGYYGGYKGVKVLLKELNNIWWYGIKFLPLCSKLKHMIQEITERLTTLQSVLFFTDLFLFGVFIIIGIKIVNDVIKFKFVKE
jgi:hypothetical protein